MGDGVSLKTLETGVTEETGLLAGGKKGSNTSSWKTNAAIWVALGGALVVLIVLAAIPSTSGGAAPPPSSPASGVIRGCPGDDALCLVVNPQFQPGYDYRNRSRTATSRSGMVAADQSRCSDIGAAILTAGGNAIDAAVAATLCQGVVNPFASTAGGGHLMLIRRANGSAEVIDAREQAPAAASQDMYKGMPSNASLLGGLAVGVPLELRGLELAWQRHGVLPWKQLVLPSVAIAQHGFAAHPYMVSLLTSPMLLALMQSDKTLRGVFLVPDGASWRPPRIGELCCKQPRLADTLQQIALHGVEWLYEAERVETLALEIQAAGGIITAQDLLDARPTIDVPLQAEVKGPDGLDLQLLFPPPPSSGAVLGLALRILAGFEEPLLAEGLLGTHRMVESMKHAFAVRLGLGDPGTAARPFWDNSQVLQQIQDPAYVDSLRAAINDSAILNVTLYGGALNPLLSGQSNLAPDDHGTSHLCVVDDQRNAVSLTSTVNTPFGSLVMSPSTGLLLNNQMDDFSKPDAPNTYGLHPSAANYIAPHKRPLSSMSPTIVLQDGQLRLVVGASGGPRIITATMQSIVRLLMLKQDPLDAISGARLHAQLLPLPVFDEQYDWGRVSLRVANATLGFLEQRGNSLAPVASMLGNSQAILIDPDTQVMVGVSDPRKDGAPAAADVVAPPLRLPVKSRGVNSRRLRGAAA